MKIFNTQSGKKEELVPIDDKRINMYVCGLTVYDHFHIGHARTFVFFDFARRFLEHIGYEVRFVMNFTDVEDKIIARAAETGEHPLHLSERFIQEYFKDASALRIRKATFHPRATEFIGDMIEFIGGLIEKGYAYAVDGDVYFSLEKVENYGRLTKQSLEDMRAGARVEIDPKKRHPYDFALWKAAKEGEISWDSPWGKGRPGWHIECSVMSKKLLGETIDIHGGGQDLIFPHHENEILQSESLTGKKFVNIWMHVGLLNLNEQKMSKSLKNFITMRELLTRHDANAVRYFFIYNHYRKPLEFSEAALDESSKTFSRLSNAYDLLSSSLDKARGENREFISVVEKYESSFIEALKDDFNTPDALSHVFEFVRELNKYLEGETNREALDIALKFLDTVAEIFGFTFKREISDISEKLMRIIIEIRENARKKKDYATSDLIRDRLKEAGITLQDTLEGARWRRD